MEHVKNSGLLRIAFDVVAGLAMLVLVNIVLGANVDLPVTVLASVLVVSATALVVRQNSKVLKLLQD